MPRGERIEELVEHLDRLESLLDRSGLSELEVEVEGTTVVLRTPDGLPAPVVPVAPAPEAEPAASPPAPVEAPLPPAAHAVVAPLTGVFYRSPSPGAEPYVREGGQVNAGQVIGLIEAMKLFNEIKSDVTGVVRRIAPDDGDLVKAKQTLIEVDPA
jgi:acetyl-CoA carboxylase biotin carboxyl carrier protein